MALQEWQHGWCFVIVQFGNLATRDGNIDATLEIKINTIWQRYISKISNNFKHATREVYIRILTNLGPLALT